MLATQIRKAFRENVIPSKQIGRRWITCWEEGMTIKIKRRIEEGITMPDINLENEWKY